MSNHWTGNLLKAGLVAAVGLGIGLAGPALAQGSEAVRIGALNPLTGAGATYGTGMQKAIQIAVDQVNEEGGVLGKKVELFTADGETDPNAAVRAVNKLVNLNKVDAVMGTYASAVTLAVLPITKRAGILEMNTSGAPAVHNQGPLAYAFYAQDLQLGKAQARYARGENYETAATMYMDNPAGIELARAFEEEFEQLGGKVVGSVRFPEGKASYDAELGKLVRNKPDIAVLESYVPDGATILKQGQAIAPEQTWMGIGFAVNPQLAEIIGHELTNGMRGMEVIPDADSKSYEYLASRYEAEMGQSVQSNVYASMTYDMVHTYALAVEHAGTKEAAAVSESMHAVTDPEGIKVYSFGEGKKLLDEGKKINYSGASGLLEFDAQNNRAVLVGVWELQDGKATVIDSFPVDPVLED